MKALFLALLLVGCEQTILLEVEPGVFQEVTARQLEPEMLEKRFVRSEIAVSNCVLVINRIVYIGRQEKHYNVFNTMQRQI